MMTAIMKKHLKKKKGFTLIEVVVVLVILAILAAIAVPALTGYISDAKERAAKSEARTVYVALQHMASTQAEDGKTYIDTTGNVLTADGAAKALTLTGMKSGTITVTNPKDIELSAAGNSIEKFTYTVNGFDVTFDNGTYTSTSV